ncbi:hypothetical protein TNCV_1721251 [Trichonephila clavipes]|nr:hypothetical protein TNCV_1721251 [Trichonephila clavipes]
MPSPVQSNCDAHDTIANGQSAFLRQQETDLPPAELVVRLFLLPDRTMIVFCRRRTSNTTSPCRLLHIPVVLNDFHSRGNNAVSKGLPKGRKHGKGSMSEKRLGASDLAGGVLLSPVFFVFQANC